MDGKRILFIGGSPCSGKSTVAERIAKDYGAYYFKVDDFLGQFMRMAAERGSPACKKCVDMTPEEIWMREPLIQCTEEFMIYDEMARLVFERLGKADAALIVTEGAAYTPKVMESHPSNDYISIIPTPDFQISHYKERAWVPYILKGCSDQREAFDRWMQRDILFAKQVKEDCEKRGIPCIVNDGLGTPDALYEKVKRLFHLPEVKC